MYDQSDLLVLKTLSNRLHTEGVIWIIISIFQIISVVGIILGIINLVDSIKTLNYSKRIMKNPVGISRSFPKTVTGGDIFAIIWNVFFGAVIGVIGNIYHIASVNSYVVNNRAVFERLESQYIRAYNSAKYAANNGQLAMN